MSSARESRAFARRTLLLILGIVGVVVLAIVLACGGLIFMVWQAGPDLRSVRSSADTFVHDIHTGHLQNAYDRTSSGFQERAAFPAFQTFVSQYPALSTYTSLICADTKVITVTDLGKHGIVRYTAIGPNNSLSFTLAFVQENGEWRVHSFTIP